MNVSWLLYRWGIPSKNNLCRMCFHRKTVWSNWLTFSQPLKPCLAVFSMISSKAHCMSHYFNTPGKGTTQLSNLEVFSRKKSSCECLCNKFGPWNHLKYKKSVHFNVSNYICENIYKKNWWYYILLYLKWLKTYEKWVKPNGWIVTMIDLKLLQFYSKDSFSKSW